MSFWSIKALENGGAELRINGEIIDDEDTWLYEWFGDTSYSSPNKFRDALKGFKGKPLTVWIDSYGGSVFAATGIYNALREHGKVTTIIDGKAMSAAFTIALAGDTVKASIGALMMAHDPLSAMRGMFNAEELRKYADVLDKVKETMLNIYEGKSTLSRDKLSEIMQKETYMTPEDALEFGFIDEIYDNSPKAKVHGFSRLAIVNCTQMDVDKIKEMIAKREKQISNPGAGRTDTEVGSPSPGNAENGGGSQPVSDKTAQDAQNHALSEQRKRFYSIQKKFLRR